MNPHRGHSGVRNWSSAFLPGSYQGTPISIGDGGTRRRVEGEDSQKPKEPIENLTNKQLSPELQRYELELLRDIDMRYAEANKHDDRLETRIKSFELAFRMQAEAPNVFNVERESEATKMLYGIDDPVTREFGLQLLTARRLVEKGVRVVQCNHEGWDQHTELARRHAEQARMVDKPIAGLLSDLAARGLLEDTLVVWGGEFGRTPYMEKDGRDHNPYGFTFWMAGGGVKPGFIYGATDDYGYHAVEDRMHVHDFHATVLHLMGLDHTKLTYSYSGRDFRLTDVAGNVATKILA
jgi:arylsulfatase A-like enzyme